MSLMKKADLVAAAIMVLAAAASGAQSGDYVYTVNPNGTVRIDEYTGAGGMVQIPAQLDGRTVVGIARYAFAASSNLTGVVIPDTVLYLEDYVFSDCTALATVTIGAGLESLGFGVFDFCDALTVINVAAGNASFSSVDGVLFNKNRQMLVQYAPGRAGDYVVPAGVTNIGPRAFMSCKRLTGITLPDGLLSVDDAAFWGCTNLPAINLPAGLLSIGDDAFWNCSGLVTVNLPDSLTGIGSHAFYECSALTSVRLPAAVENVGAWAFGRCAGLTAITVDGQNPGYSSLAGVLFNKDRTILIQYPGGKTGTYVVPNSVTNIAGPAADYNEGLGGFAYCAGLTGLVIPESVVEIGNNAFRDCTGLTGLTLPEGLVAIGFSSFAYCTSLTDITLPDSLRKVEYMSFIGCAALTSITLSDNVTNIGAAAFASCTALTVVTAGIGLETIEESAFWNCENLAGVYFWGHAPETGPTVFGNSENVTVYHLPGTLGWGTELSGRPTALWTPGPLPAPKIRANGRRGHVRVAHGDKVSVTVTMAAGGYPGYNVDWWAVARPVGADTGYYLDGLMQWRDFPADDLHAVRPAHQGPLGNMFAPATILPAALLAPGTYMMYFAVDPMDGILNYPDGPIMYDTVTITVD